MKAMTDFVMKLLWKGIEKYNRSQVSGDEKIPDNVRPINSCTCNADNTVTVIVSKPNSRPKKAVNS